MKLSAYAKKVGVSYLTAWRWFKRGQIAGYQAASGTIIVTETEAATASAAAQKVAVYARVSAAENRGNLEGQAGRLLDFCAARGYQVAQVIKEIGSGVNGPASARPNG